jgi:hypothetical protein
MKLLFILTFYSIATLACELKVGDHRLAFEKTQCAFPTDKLRTCYQLAARNGKRVDYGATPIFPGTPGESYCIVAPTVDLFRSARADGPRAEIDCKSKKNEITLSWKGQKKICPLPKN